MSTFIGNMYVKYWSWDTVNRVQTSSLISYFCPYLCTLTGKIGWPRLWRFQTIFYYNIGFYTKINESLKFYNSTYFWASKAWKNLSLQSPLFQSNQSINCFLKVRRSPNDFLKKTFLPKKTNEQIQLYYYDTSDRLVFVCFLEETEETKKTFQN